VRGVAVGGALWRGVSRGGRGRRFDSHQLNYPFIFFFCLCFSFHFSFVIAQIRIFHISYFPVCLFSGFRNESGMNSVSSLSTTFHITAVYKSSDRFFQVMSVHKPSGVRVGVGVSVLGGVAVGDALWRGMSPCGRSRRFDSHQLNCPFIFSFLVSVLFFSFVFLSFLRFAYLISHISYFPVCLFSKSIRHEQCGFPEDDVS
jgi:hypothetical protein